MPFGDLQMGAEGFREDLWKRFFNQALADKEAWLIGMGDYSDAFRPTIRARLNGTFADDKGSRFQLDTHIMKSMQSLAEKLQPLKNRIIGLLEGHHYYDLVGGMTSTQYLCQLLGVKYLSFACVVQLHITRSKSHKKIVDIFATHGCGGSKYSHSDLAHLERNIMPSWDCDLYLRGHSTKVYVAHGAPLNKISRAPLEKGIKILKRQRLLVNTGGFMEGYVPGTTTYVEEKNLPPCALGWAVIELHIRNTKGEDRENFTPFEITGTAIVP